MAEIDTAIKYSPEQLKVIERKLNDVNFTHSEWSSDDLQNLRSGIRDFYRIKQNGKCAYCQNDISIRSAANCHVEHIIPKSIILKFIFEPKNLCVICADCNEIKRNKEVLNNEQITTVNKTPKQYPRASNSFLIVHPHFDNYNDHIEKFGQYFFDKTNKGHFTIGACLLNRRLREFGWEEQVIDENIVRMLMQSYMDSSDRAQQATALRSLIGYLSRYR